MTHQERIAQWRKDVGKSNETAGQVLAYDRENRCWRLMPKTEAAQKGYLHSVPDDMRVGLLTQDVRVKW